MYLKPEVSDESHSRLFKKQPWKTQTYFSLCREHEQYPRGLQENKLSYLLLFGEEEGCSK